MSDSKGAMALIQHFPRSNWLPYACITTSIFFIIAQCGLMSFDIHVQMDIDMIITSMHYNADIKEYSILTGIIRMVQPDESGHSYILIAVLLFLWSGVWPHLKLFLLYRALTTEFTTDERGRRLQFLGHSANSLCSMCSLWFLSSPRCNSHTWEAPTITRWVWLVRGCTSFALVCSSRRF